MNLRIRLQDRWRSLLRSLGVNVSLCRTCQYNDPKYCVRRQRPNATICEDYRRK